MHDDTGSLLVTMDSMTADLFYRAQRLSGSTIRQVQIKLLRKRLPFPKREL
jgi:hypothetical protein